MLVRGQLLRDKTEVGDIRDKIDIRLKMLVYLFLQVSSFIEDIAIASVNNL